MEIRKIEKNYHDNYSWNWCSGIGTDCVICNDGIVEIPNEFGLVFELNPDSKSYAISGITSEGNEHTIKIPHHYKGVPVTKINDFALKNASNISLYIPHTIKEIGEKAIGQAFFHYIGTKREWLNISKAKEITTSGSYIVICFDGEIESDNFENQS